MRTNMASRGGYNVINRHREHETEPKVRISEEKYCSVHKKAEKYIIAIEKKVLIFIIYWKCFRIYNKYRV